MIIPKKIYTNSADEFWYNFVDLISKWFTEQYSSDNISFYGERDVANLLRINQETMIDIKQKSMLESTNCKASLLSFAIYDTLRSYQHDLQVSGVFLFVAF